MITRIRYQHIEEDEAYPSKINVCIRKINVYFQQNKVFDIEKFGMCPYCDILFKKRRKDQEYCSEKHRKLTQNRRLYKKKKAA